MTLKDFIFKGINYQDKTIIDCPINEKEIIQLMDKRGMELLENTDNIIFPDVIPNVFIVGSKKEETFNEILKGLNEGVEQ